MRIRVNANVHNEDYIAKALLAKDKNLRIEMIDRIYYPYAITVHEIKMRNPKSQMNRKIMCVLDLVNGRGAIGDKDPTLTEIEVDDILVVDRELTDEELAQKSHEYVFKIVLGKVRVLYLPEIVLTKTDYFHKLFYVVHCKDAKELDYFLLVDSMDASLTVLEH